MKKPILVSTLSVLLFSSLATSGVFAESTDKDVQNLNNINNQNMYSSGEDLGITVDVLSAIENIPESVVDQGIDETVKWLSNETGLKVTVDGEENLEFTYNSKESIPTMRSKRSVSPWDVTVCVGVVGLQLVSVGLPFTKLLKAKSAIKALGGTSKAIQKIKPKYDLYRAGGFSQRDAMKRALEETTVGLSKTAKDALLDFFGITAIAGACNFQ